MSVCSILQFRTTCITQVVTVVDREYWLTSSLEKSSALTQTCFVTLVCGRCGTSRCWSVEALARHGQIMVMTSCRHDVTGHSVGAINTTMTELHALPCPPSGLLRIPTEPLGHFLPSVAFEVHTVLLVLAPRVYGHFRLYSFHDSPYMLHVILFFFAAEF
jgi:hypothetical protein